MTEDVEFVNVKSARNDDRVAFYERDDRHPEDAVGFHEAFVAGKLVVKVARTPNVEVAIRAGDIVITDEPVTPTALPENTNRTPPLSQEGPQGMREAQEQNRKSQEAMDKVEPATPEDVEESKKMLEDNPPKPASGPGKVNEGDTGGLVTSENLPAKDSNPKARP